MNAQYSDSDSDWGRRGSGFRGVTVVGALRARRRDPRARLARRARELARPAPPPSSEKRPELVGREYPLGTVVHKSAWRCLGPTLIELTASVQKRPAANRELPGVLYATLDLSRPYSWLQRSVLPSHMPTALIPPEAPTSSSRCLRCKRAARLGHRHPTHYMMPPDLCTTGVHACAWSPHGRPRSRLPGRRLRIRLACGHGTYVRV